VYEALKAIVEAAGVEVFDRARFDDEPSGTYKRAERGQPPIICVHHEGRSDARHEPYDTLTLAHEYGHHLSHVAGHPAQLYWDAIEVPWCDWKTLLQSTRDAIYAEETRAWSNAVRVLKEHPELGFNDWAALEKRRSESLAEYRVRLGLAD
jgi:hypothetical protein